MPDYLTVLHSVHKKHAAKQFALIPGKKGNPDRIQNKTYGKESHFRVEQIPIGNFGDLDAALRRLAADPFAFIIRDDPLPHTNLNHTRRWARAHGNELATFVPIPRQWLPVDLDHITAPALTDVVTDPEAAIEYLIGLLPKELHDVKCRWQLTSSQGLPGSEGLLSARLYYWLSEAYDNDALKRWAAAANAAAGFKLIDPVLYHPIQAIYTAAPLFRNMTDPLPRRCGVRDGLDDEACLIIPPADRQRPELISDEGWPVGHGVEAYLAQIGRPHFREPLRSAIASYIAIYGATADTEPVKKAIRQAFAAIDPAWAQNEKLCRYGADEHLDDIIAAIRAFQGNKPGKGWTQPPPPYLDLPPPSEPEPAPVPVIRPIVQVAAGHLPAVVDAAEAILIEADRNLYEFGDQVVRPARAPIKIADNKTTIGLRLVPVRLHHMIERFTRCIEFRKFNKKENKWLPIDCPEAVAKTYLERVGLWRLPKLTALTSCPLLLRDGRIIERPGFDAASGILFDPQGVEFPPMLARPTEDDARLALEDLKALFREFPFVDNRARSVLLSALLTSVSRLAYDFTPLHGFDAPAAGTGKSKLVNCCSILLNGHECPVISQGDDETEFEKRLGAELLEGARLISIDNCELSLGGALLCQTATQHFIKVRVLGFSKSVLIVNTALLFATGNNLKLYGDMLRRGLICRLDAGEERPELRTFEQEDPERALKRERGRYAVAALTVLRAYIIAGRPIRRQPLGGFEGWSDLVRNALLWLGEEDPVETVESARAEDPERQRLEAVIAQWHAVLEYRSITARAVIDEACASRFEKGTGPNGTDHHVLLHPDFRNALLDVANERGRVSAGRLGKWLSANKHKIVGNHRLAAAPLSAGSARWKLEERDAEGKWR
jgi:hypothetical protein